ncbi:hypothetical protein EZS27_027831, partial [termite gut metagenome]
SDRTALFAALLSRSESHGAGMVADEKADYSQQVAKNNGTTRREV